MNVNTLRLFGSKIRCKIPVEIGLKAKLINRKLKNTKKFILFDVVDTI